MQEDTLVEVGGEHVSRRGFARNLALGAAIWPDSPGAVPTAGGLLDVRGFGAKGDGKSDDTKALQSALDTAGEKRGAVFVPPGTYMVSELRMRRHTALIGVPAWGFGNPGGSILQLTNPNAKCLLNITEAPGVTIEGLSLEGARLGKGVHGIFLDKPDPGKAEDGFRIERCRVARFTGDGVCLKHVWCFSIRHSMIGFNDGHGVTCIGWDGFLMDNWLSGNGGAGFLGADSASITATGNRVEWNYRAGFLIKDASHYNITGNYIDRSGTCGLEVVVGARRSKHMSITGNLFYRSGKRADPQTHESSHVRMEGGQGITFIGNTLAVGRDDFGKGDWSPSLGIVYKGLENCIVKDNVLHQACLRELLVDLGSHGEGVIVKDNPGSIFTPPAPKA